MISKAAVKKLCDIYLDQVVIIHLKNMSVVTVDNSGNELKVSPMIDGLILDIDEEFIHIGMPDGHIYKSVPHDTVGLIEIMEMDAFITADLPSADEEVH